MRAQAAGWPLRRGADVVITIVVVVVVVAVVVSRRSGPSPHIRFGPRTIRLSNISSLSAPKLIFKTLVPGVVKTPLAFTLEFFGVKLFRLILILNLNSLLTLAWVPLSIARGFNNFLRLSI